MDNGPFSASGTYCMWSDVADTEHLRPESSEFELATGVLQKAADYKGPLQDLASTLPKEEVDESNSLEVEYFIIRTALVGFPPDQRNMLHHLSADIQFA